jgi:hypothetical protein
VTFAAAAIDGSIELAEAIGDEEALLMLDTLKLPPISISLSVTVTGINLFL